MEEFTDFVYFNCTAFAELLDNALDEVCNGATYVNADVLDSMKFNNKMLLVEGS